MSKVIIGTTRMYSRSTNGFTFECIQGQQMASHSNVCKVNKWLHIRMYTRLTNGLTFECIQGQQMASHSNLYKVNKWLHIRMYTGSTNGFRLKWM